MDTVVDVSALEISAWEIVLRLLCAMLIGAVIGTEREYTHRPAGMRTHMLVSLGACVVMITSQMIFCQYRPYGATPDPARLSAQVITGVGFLGAGTIIREGASIKGLTTAASIWAVACLGIAAGGGYYALALIGAAAMMITLVIFEWLQKKLIHARSTLHMFRVSCTDALGMLERIKVLAQENDASIHAIEVERRDDGTVDISFKAEFAVRHSEERMHKFLADLSSDPLTIAMKSERSRM
ncbi:MAG: MgtC/SapB family protein [Firmicutes bacterium]|nr:MgtC/SapB family protein [Bacillota bacterium]